TDDHVKGLLALRDLEALSIYSDKVTAGGIVALKDLAKLRHIEVNNAMLTDDGLAAIVEAKLLHKLHPIASRDMDRTRPDGPEGISQLTLIGGSLTGKGLRPIRIAKNLEILDIRGVPVAADDLRLLRDFPRLSGCFLTARRSTMPA